MARKSHIKMSKTDLSERDQKILALSWQCFKTHPDIDFDKLAGLAGHTNVGTTRNAMAALKKKLAAIAEKDRVYTEDVDDATSAAPMTPVKGASARPARTSKPTPKRKAVDEDAQDDSADDDATAGKEPKKKAAKGKTTTRASGRAIKKVRAEDVSEEQDDESEKEAKNMANKGKKVTAAKTNPKFPNLKPPQPAAAATLPTSDDEDGASNVDEDEENPAVESPPATNKKREGSAGSRGSRASRSGSAARGSREGSAAAGAGRKSTKNAKAKPAAIPEEIEENDEDAV